MKIVIPVEENSLQTKVCMSFGRTPYFLIYDAEKEEKIIIDNSAAASRGGAGIKAAQLLVDNQADILITPRCGENAAEALKASGIKMYKTINDCVQDNIDALLKGNLSFLEDIHPGFHNHG